MPPTLNFIPYFSQTYDTLKQLPGGLGNRVFERLGTLMVPHAARMGFRLVSLSPTDIEVSMPDKRGNRNHLNSLHAMALAHLGEFTTGILTLYAVAPLGYRTILRKYEIEYTAKARGRITARAHVALPKKKSLDKVDFPVRAELTDRDGQVVATVTATWRIGRMARS